ncbi:MAG: cation transporter [Halobacteriovoraceae bacterium]|nr:cation transporter [Halobacteriovoraceae bacterium]|tara:strand:- start:69707 stop:70735 length:1029 start_codon:yes stop_codon:yes gene_type:complete
MLDLWPIHISILGFIISVVGLLTIGIKLVTYADNIADRFRLGEALVGGLFLGAITSLSGSIVSGLSAYNGYHSLAINNCLGGIAAQTTFLIIADMTYRNVNLEHAAASLPNLVSCNLLISLLGLSFLGAVIEVPEWLFIHPVSVVMLVLYLFGLKWLQETYKNPLWIPKRTKETRLDEPRPDSKESSVMLVTKFTLSACVVAVLGYVITKSAESLISTTGLAENIAGGFLTAVITSLPELVVSLSAVRQGALTMAVANILGGNTFDVLMLVIADALSLEAPIYSYYKNEEFFLTSVILLMTSIIAIALARREKQGPGDIGFEGVSILAIYFVSATLLVFKFV